MGEVRQYQVELPGLNICSSLRRLPPFSVVLQEPTRVPIQSQPVDPKELEDGEKEAPVVPVIEDSYIGLGLYRGSYVRTPDSVTRTGESVDPLRGHRPLTGRLYGSGTGGGLPVLYGWMVSSSGLEGGCGYRPTGVELR